MNSHVFYKSNLGEGDDQSKGPWLVDASQRGPIPSFCLKRCLFVITDVSAQAPRIDVTKITALNLRTPSKEPSMPETPLSGLRLFFVEDDVALGALLAGILEKNGALVDGPWSSVKSATGAMRHHPPEAAILDVNLHDGTTYALAASLQSLGISYAFLSASEPSDVPSQLAPFAFVRKPAPTWAVLAVARRLAEER